MDEAMYVDLYNEMATTMFLAGIMHATQARHSFWTMRRHAFTEPFHPKYGGNAGAYAWDYIQERYAPFDWRSALEAPQIQTTKANKRIRNKI